MSSPLPPSRPTGTAPQPVKPASPPAKTPSKLVVGHGIVFSGEITCCDCLVVEGTVKANITGCHDIQIAEGGLFSGAASVNTAEIHGRFEGELQVSELLKIHAGGAVAAKVHYHQIEIERGGQITGDVVADAAPQAAIASIARRA
ncbi:MAG TPA: polymer-forming cytoskeletal protein [Stellaceae bacterium]|nr:polymer-forming cytoskeletal protein [Stellaceae bacterium]